MDRQQSVDYESDEDNEDVYDQQDYDSNNNKISQGNPNLNSYIPRGQGVILPQQPPQAPENFNPQDFIFPPEEFQNIQWTSIEEIKQYLDKGIYKLKLQYSSRLYVQRSQFGHILFKCKICHSRITFSKPQNYKLIRFENRHKHQLRQIMERNEDQNIYNYLLQIPFIQGIFLNTEIRYMVKNKFDVSKEKAKAISDRFLKNYMELEFILDKIMRQTSFVFKRFYNEEERETTAVLMINQEMKKRYQKYGVNDCICIDLKKRILTNVNENGKIWQVLFIYGQDNDLNILLFSVCLVADKSPQMYATLFESFFQLNCNLLPQTLITKEVPGLVEGLKLLNQKIPLEKRWAHLLDWRSKLKKIRDSLRRKKFTEDEITLLLSWFGQVIVEPSPTRFTDVLNRNKLHKIDDELVNELLQKKDQYCLSHFPNSFCGFAPATTRNDRYNSIIRKNFKPGKTFAKFFYEFLKYEETQSSIEDQQPPKCNVVKHNIFPQLHLIQPKLQPNIFSKLIQNFTHTIDMQSVRLSDTQYKVTHLSQIDQLNLIQGTNIWSCTCRYQEKVGIPCMHQLKVIGQYPFLIQQHIHKRWLVKSGDIKKQDKVKFQNTIMEQNLEQMCIPKIHVKRQDAEAQEKDEMEPIHLRGKTIIRD